MSVHGGWAQRKPPRVCLRTVCTVYGQPAVRVIRSSVYTMPPQPARKRRSEACAGSTSGTGQSSPHAVQADTCRSRPLYIVVEKQRSNKIKIFFPIQNDRPSAKPSDVENFRTDRRIRSKKPRFPAGYRQLGGRICRETCGKPGVQQADGICVLRTKT